MLLMNENFVSEEALFRQFQLSEQQDKRHKDRHSPRS